MPEQPRRRRRRWLRIAIIALFVPVVLAGLAMFLMRQSWVVVPLVEPLLADELGGDVEIGAAKVEGSSTIILRDVVLRSRAHEGDAGEIARVGTITIGTNLIGLLFGRTEPLEILMADATFRVSEDADHPGDFSFMALERREDDDAESEAQPLTLHLQSGKLEVGTHRGETFTRTGALPVAGTIESAGAEEEWFKFELWETVAGGLEVPADPLRIKGRINIDTQATEGRIDGLIFDERLKGLCPHLVQAWWDALDPEGAVRDARLEVDGQGGIAASINVRDVALTIPIEREDVWRRYALGTDNTPAGLPRMRVQSGRVELRGGILTLDNLSGVLLSSERTRNLAEVPYHVNGTFGSRGVTFDWNQREQWVDQLLHFAPINLTCVMEDFRFDGTPGSRNSAVELPAAITRALEQFSVASCTLDTSITITRADAAIGADGAPVEQEIITAGRAKLSEGRGAYVKFAYPLEDVSAEMRFDNTQVVVETLLARGPNGGTISIGGTIHPPTKWPNVDLHISAVDMPTDEHLRTALPERYRRVLDALRHVPSYDALAAAQALPDEAVLERARAESVRLIEERQALAADQSTGPDDPDRAERLAALDRRISSLDRVIRRGGFEMSGSINMEIDIDRVEGQGQKTLTTGLIEIVDAGLVLDHFPYPFTVDHGLLHLERERVIVENWVGDSAGGGRVYVRGAIDTPVIDGKTRVQPNLQIGVFDDVTNAALVQAVALAGSDGSSEPDEGPSAAEQALARAASLLEASALDGMLSWEGTVVTDESGDVGWDFAVALDSGRAAPTDEGAQRMRDLGVFWPRGFAVENVAGSFNVADEAVRIARIGAERGEGVVTVEGEISMDGGGVRTALNLDFTDFAVEPYLLAFVPPESRARADEIWERWQPEGRFDAKLRYGMGEGQQQDPEGADPAGMVTVELWPRDLSLLVGGARLPLSGVTTPERPATLTAENDAVMFNGLRLALGSTDSNDGVLELSGDFGGKETSGDSLRGTLTGGRFESRWLTEMYSLAKADRWAQWVSQYQPQGRFDADFELAAAPEQPARFTAAVRPESISIVFNETPVNAALEPGGTIHIEPGRAILRVLSGRLGTGAQFVLEGEIDTDDLVDAQLRLGYEGDVFDVEAAAFIPEALLTGLREINLATEAPVRFVDAQVRLQQLDDRGDDGEPLWRRTFRGNVAVNDASFEAGLMFTSAGGLLAIDAVAQEGLPPRVQVGIDLERIIAKGRRLTDVSGSLALSEDGESILLSDLAGSCYGGMATASATIALGEEAPYEARIDLTGVNLRGFSRAREDRPDNESPLAESSSATDGTLFANISLQGYRGAPEERRGRGSIEVVDGTLASNPITLPFIQLSQLMLPLDAALDYGESSFFILGERAIIERFVLESDRLILLGAGTVRLDDLEVDLRLRSRGRLLGISDVVGALSDQLYGIAVTGPLADPNASIVAVPAISGLFREPPREAIPPPMRSGSGMLRPKRDDAGRAEASGGEPE